uniref:Uncharacterized protein n=1 Tax=Romanomermis culicivorax TaxID=13658 RepID=A0A915IXZ1_ROMCU
MQAQLKIYESIKANFDKAADISKKYSEQKACKHKINIKDLILLTNTQKANKIQSDFICPFIITNTTHLDGNMSLCWPIPPFSATPSTKVNGFPDIKTLTRTMHPKLLTVPKKPKNKKKKQKDEWNKSPEVSDDDDPSLLPKKVHDDPERLQAVIA